MKCFIFSSNNLISCDFVVTFLVPAQYATGREQKFDDKSNAEIADAHKNRSVPVAHFFYSTELTSI